MPPRPRPNPGRLGGLASSAKLTPEQREARAAMGGNATLRIYGVGYYSALAKSQRKKIDNVDDKS